MLKIIVLTDQVVAPASGASDMLLSVISIVLGIVSIVISVIFFIKSNELTNKTNETLKHIENVTSDLKSMHNDIIKNIVQSHIGDHKTMIENHFAKTANEASLKKSSEK